jgi:basic amino acid/polyamine antiporter, APA family
MTTDSTPTPRLSSARVFGFWTCLALMVGNFIGSGIFLLPATLAPYGWNALLGWVFTIAGALCLAFVFARLSRALPRAGGPVAFVREAFGPGPAFGVAWGYWIAIVVGNSAIAVAVISYASMFVPQLAGTPGLGAFAALAVLWSMTAINCASVRAAGGVQLVTTILKLVPLAAVIGIAVLLVGRGEAVSQVPLRVADLSLAGITAAATLTLWAMLGVESAAVGAGKVRDPERTVPRATLIGTMAVGIVYLLVSGAVGLLMPVEEIAQSNFPLADFVARFWGEGPAQLVGLFAMISGIGALNGWVLLQGEIPLAMARQGVFPRWFARTSAGGVAVRAQLVSSGLATLLIAANYHRSVVGLFLFMALLATTATLLLYLACSLAALRLQREGRLERSRLLTCVAVAGAVYSVWTIYGAGHEAMAWGAVLLASAVPLYFLMRDRVDVGIRGEPAIAPEG